MKFCIEHQLSIVYDINSWFRAYIPNNLIFWARFDNTHNGREMSVGAKRSRASNSNQNVGSLGVLLSWLFPRNLIFKIFRLPDSLLIVGRVYLMS